MIRFAAVRRSVLALALVLMAGAAPAQTFPKFTGLVVDTANVIPPAEEAALTAKLEALQKDTNRQFVVMTVPDTQGYALSDYGYRLGREWGAGLRDVNNGAILFAAPGNPAGQRGPRIEVGRGLEPILTDAMSSVIINQQMMPRIRDGQIAAGMIAGADAVVAQLRAAPEEAKARTDAAAAQFDKDRRRSSTGDDMPLGIVFGVMLIGFIALSFMRKRGGKGQRYRGGGRDGGRDGGGSGMLPIVLWSIANEIGRNAGSGGGWGGGSGGGGGGGSDGSWGGGGFTGGGGGDFGGGGASGDW